MNKETNQSSKSEITSLTYNCTENYIMTGTNRGSLTIWDIKTSKCYYYIYLLFFSKYKSERPFSLYHSNDLLNYNAKYSCFSFIRPFIKILGFAYK